VSTSNTVTVWCDGCDTWQATGVDAKEARSEAKAMGWAVNLPPTQDRPRKRRDLCPSCRRNHVPDV